MLEEQDLVTGYQNRPVGSEGGQEHLTSGADLNVDILSKSVDDDNDWDFDGAVDGKYAQHIGMKPKLLDLQDECWTKKWRVLSNVSEAVELSYELLRSAHVPVHTVPSSKAPVTTGGGTTGLTAELDKSKARISELVSAETTKVRYNEPQDKVKQCHAEKVNV